MIKRDGGDGRKSEAIVDGDIKYKNHNTNDRIAINFWLNSKRKNSMAWKSKFRQRVFERKRERDNEWLTVHVKISSLVESHFGYKERESECMFYTVIILSRACATKKGLKMTQIFVHLQSNRSVLIRIFTWLPREEGLVGTANTINGRESCFTFRLIFSVSV